MTLSFHPADLSDFSAATAYYAAEGGEYLAARFEAEFRRCLTSIKAGPTRFPYYQSSRVFRRIR